MKVKVLDLKTLKTRVMEERFAKILEKQKRVSIVQEDEVVAPVVPVLPVLEPKVVEPKVEKVIVAEDKKPEPKTPTKKEAEGKGNKQTYKTREMTAE
jgi:hypothetical protein